MQANYRTGNTSKLTDPADSISPTRCPSQCSTPTPPHLLESAQRRCWAHCVEESGQGARWAEALCAWEPWAFACAWNHAAWLGGTAQLTEWFGTLWDSYCEKAWRTCISDDTQWLWLFYIFVVYKQQMVTIMDTLSLVYLWCILLKFQFKIERVVQFL